MSGHHTTPSFPRLIPLLSRNGEVRAYAIVDADDHDHLNQWTWRLTSHGYASRGEDGRHIYMHRFLTGEVDGYEVDHINGQTLDNRRANLRLVNHRENLGNLKSRRPSSSRFRGVHRKRNRWVAQTRVGTNPARTIHLGTFDTEEEAAAAVETHLRNHSHTSHFEFAEMS